MISFKEASKIIENTFGQLKPDTEIIPFEKALHRTLAEDVFADIDLPPFNNSAMDGIAIRFNKNIKRWRVIGEISAGNYNDYDLDENSAVSIMTGARIPDFCDTVIPVEDLELEQGTTCLKKNAKFKIGMNVRKKGSDIAKNEIAISDFTYLEPKHIATLATCGKSELKVIKKLQIGVLATGDELIPVEEKPSGDKIRLSNTYSILASINELNMAGIDCGIIPDKKEMLLQSIADALNSEIDILITTGGVSVGKFDYVKDIFEQLGVEIKFWRVNIKPGKPLVFGIFNKLDKIKLIFGLPGNPVSSLVNFELFVRKNINKVFHQPERERVKAVLQNNLKKKDKKRHFMRGILTKNEKGFYEAGSNFNQSSGNLVEMSKANCLMIIEEEMINPVKGTEIECIMI